MEICIMKLRAKNICKTFANRKSQKIVLENISFDIEEGQFVTLLGPSGCGKTTMLSIIAGFEKSDSGVVELDEEIVSGPHPDRAFVFQSYALFPWMTVKENILFPMKQMNVPHDERCARLEHLLEISKLKSHEELYPHQISGGMKQRTALVRALAGRPKVLLMDEPLGALDLMMRQSLQSEIENIWREEKITALMVTHDVDEAVYLSDKVILMSTNRGEIVHELINDLPRPRNRYCEKYKAYCEMLIKKIMEKGVLV